MVDTSAIGNQFDDVLRFGENSTVLIEQPEVEDGDLVAHVVDDVVFDAQDLFIGNFSREKLWTDFNAGRLKIIFETNL